MRKAIILTLAFLPLVLAGCGEDHGPSATSASSADLEPSGSQAFDRRQLEEPLPEAFELPFAYHLRSDRVVEGEGPERRIQVDVFGLNADGTLEAITRRFRDQGYRPSKPRARTEGGQRVIYRHEDGRHATASVWAPDQKKTVSPGAESVAYIAWRLEHEAPVSEGGDEEGARQQ